MAALLAVGALGWFLRRRGRATAGTLAAGFGLTLVPVVVAPLGWLLWAAITTIRPGYAELLDPYRPVWYRLSVVALAAAVLFCWYALLRAGSARPRWRSADWPGSPCSVCCSPWRYPAGRT
ncbi:hypothetical protein V2I01_09650 [Micromonospora sp. BRA006-A]|nr:hypothetical protein [Micromonospora sp. BRA006-A]